MTTCRLRAVDQRRVVGIVLWAALGVMLTGAVIATPVAHACCGGPNPLPPVGGNAFVNDVKSDGITTKDGSDQVVMNMGSPICGEVYNGETSTIIAIEIPTTTCTTKSPLGGSTILTWSPGSRPLTWSGMPITICARVPLRSRAIPELD